MFWLGKGEKHLGSGTMRVRAAKTKSGASFKTDCHQVIKGVFRHHGAVGRAGGRGAGRLFQAARPGEEEKEGN